MQARLVVDVVCSRCRLLLLLTKKILLLQFDPVNNSSSDQFFVIDHRQLYDLAHYCNLVHKLERIGYTY